MNKVFAAFKNVWVQSVLLWAIIFGVGLYFRLYPLLNYQPNEASEKATLFVIAQMKKQFAREVEQKHPEMSKEQQQKLADKHFAETFHKERDRVRATIDKLATQIGGEISGPDYPYLLASDSFHYLYLTERLHRTGKISDQIKGSKYFHDLMLAPSGHWEPMTLHPHIGYSVYRVIKIFNPDVSIMYAVSFTSLVLTALIALIFVWTARILNFSWISTLTSGIFFILAPIFLKRSTFGWYDNDPYNVLFPLLLSALSIFGIRNLQQGKKFIANAFYLALLVMLYALFWQGWMFLFVILFSALATTFLLTYFTSDIDNRKSVKKYTLSFFIGAFLAISIVFGIGEFFVLFQEGWKALKNFLSPQLALWPDLYMSVGELHQASLSLLIEIVGGIIFFGIALFGLVAEAISALRSKNIARIYVVMLCGVFLAFAFLISMGAQRFAMLCLVPVALLFPFGLDHCKKILERFIPTKIPLMIFTFACLALSVIPIRHAQATIRSLLNPIYNQTWDTTLKKIAAKTPANSVINTWWSPGHFIKATAQRRVTFDGATINFPQAYWISNIFLSTSEEEALGLIRMLNTSGNAAADFLQSHGIPLSTTVQILKEITRVDHATAQGLLERFIEEPSYVEELLNMTHGNDPSSYLLLYNEFVEKNIQLRLFGHWNFEAIENINKDLKLIKEVPKRNSPEYMEFLWQLVGGQYRYSGELSEIQRNGDVVMFAENISINLTNQKTRINSSQYGVGIPKSIFYEDGDKVVEKIFPNATLGYSVLLTQNKGKYSAVLAEYPLAKSILLQLYFFKGKGMQHFKLFADESDLTGRTQIQVYEVVW